MVGWFFRWLVIRRIGWTVSWLVGGLVGLLFDRWVAWTVG